LLKNRKNTLLQAIRLIFLPLPHPVEQEIEQAPDTENTSELRGLQQELQKAKETIAQLQQQQQETKSQLQGQCWSVLISKY